MIRQIGFYLLLAAIVALFSYGSVFASDILTIHGKVTLPEEKVDADRYHEGFRSAVSQKNLLNLKRDQSLALPQAALSSDAVTTIRICAIRVQFQYEDTDDEYTTGRGHFDFRTQEEFLAQELHAIDMSPHNRTYFESHLRALNEYWSVVSGGRLELEWDVFPTIEDSVYELSQPMGHYGEQLPQYGLGEFFVESFEIADGDSEIDFSEYDAYMVFHAGADQQQDIENPYTPYDLYTGFIILGPTLIVDQDVGDPIQIDEGVMMPETASQDNKVVALNGVFAHEFGHQLGLVDLYDTRTFMTQVGDFSLMDNQGRGTAADLGFERSSLVLDVLPVMPDAWSRAYLGFADVVEVTNVSDFDVWAAEIMTDQPQIVKVPISDYEYYLIENRQVDSDRDDSTNLRIDSITGVILGPAPADPDDPRYLTRDYDFFLPGSGILIWHIDETRAYLNYSGASYGNNFTYNTLQWYSYEELDDPMWENRRFVSVVEADGVIDFGGNYRTRYGSADDFFYRGNNTSFLPTTNPSTRSVSGAYTGIRIYDISNIDTVMQITVRVDSRVEGYPKFLNESRFPPVLTHLDRDGLEEIIIAGENHLLGMELDGSPLIEPLAGQAVLDSVFILNGDEPSDGIGDVVMPGGYIIKGGTYLQDTLRSIASLQNGATFTTAPIIANFDNGSVAKAAVGTSSGSVEIWNLIDTDSDGLADFHSSIETGNEQPITRLVSYPLTEPGYYNLLAADESGMLYDMDVANGTVNSTETGEVAGFAVDPSSGEIFILANSSSSRQSAAILLSDGTIVHDFGDHICVSLTAADLDCENGTDFAALRSDGYLCILRSLSSSVYDFDAFSINVDDSLAGGVVTASLDPTSTDYQIIFGGNNRLHVYNHNGTQFENFPQIIDIHKSIGMIEADPLVADVSGDGVPDIVIGTQSGEVFAYGTDGLPVDNFPRFSGSEAYIAGAIIEGNSSNNYSGKILASNEDNRLYMLPVSSRPMADEELWKQSGFNEMGANFRSRSTLTPEEPAGSDLIVSFYNYPNPAESITNIRYRLRSEGTVNIQIYDVSGRLVYEDNTSGGETSEEYVWTLDGMPPGIYICRMEVVSGGQSDVKTHKIAVVK